MTKGCISYIFCFLNVNYHRFPEDTNSINRIVALEAAVKVFENDLSCLKSAKGNIRLKTMEDLKRRSSDLSCVFFTGFR